MPLFTEVAMFLLRNRRAPASFLLKDITKPVAPDNIRNIYAALPLDMQTKVQVYTSASELQGRSIILTGFDSLLKDEIALCVLMWYASQNKKVCYYSSPNDEEIEAAYATAIMRIDSIDKFKLTKVQNSLISSVTENRVLILSAPNLDSILSSLGESTAQLVLTKPFVQIETPDQEITSIKL